MRFSEFAQRLQVLHRQQLAVSDSQGAGLAKGFEGLGGQRVHHSFVDAVEPLDLALACLALQGDGPGLDQLVLGQCGADALGECAVGLYLAEEVEHVFDALGGVALFVEEALPFRVKDKAAGV